MPKRFMPPRSPLLPGTLLLLLVFVAVPHARGQAGLLRIALFESDAMPPLGTPLSVEPATKIVDALRVRGVVLLTDELPIVLCTVDWLKISNGGHEAWRTALAEAAGTSPDRVAVHVLHQHDAPTHDADAELLLPAHGIQGQDKINADFAREAIRRAAAALRHALKDPQPVTHLGLGMAAVEDVASNRQVLGPDGKTVW